MRIPTVIAVLAMGAAGAQADEPTILDACMFAVEKQLGPGDYTATEVQAFPELSPPRVSFIVVEPYEPSVADLLAKEMGTKTEAPTSQRVGAARCSFASAAAPFGLAEFCVSDSCYLGLAKSRIEEIQVLLTREGY